jgi:outer membrane protein TolC
MRARRTLATRYGQVLAVLLVVVPPADALAETNPAVVPTELNDPMLVPAAAATRTVKRFDEALALVRSRSTDLRTAEVEIDRAEAQWRTALAGSLPSANVNGTLSRQLLTETIPEASGPGTPSVEVPFPNVASGSLSLVQPVVAPRAWFALGTARQSKVVAELNVEEIKRQLVLRVANGLVAVVTSERLAELNRSGLRNALERLGLTERKANLGGGTQLDVVRARQDVEAARATLVTGDESLRQSREALGLALGLPQAIGVSPDLRLDGLEQATLAACSVQDKLEGRPDVNAASESVRLADRAHGDVERQFLPTVNIQSALSTTSLDTSPAPRTTWNIQGVLNFSLWDGGARYASRRIADVETERAAQRLEAVRRQATIEIVQARRAIDVAEQSREVARKARDLAAEVDRLARASFQEGRGTSLELVSAATSLRQAEISLALREFELIRARIGSILSRARCRV